MSRRFRALVTTHHAWRIAFLRSFPGHAAFEAKAGEGDPEADVLRSETRYFSRLTTLATWRSEYLFRTRYLRGLARGKPGTTPGGIGLPGRLDRNGKKTSAVLTYNSKLPWLVTNIHAIFASGKKPPRAIQGAGDLGVATQSDPTTGKIEKWGTQDPFGILQLDEVSPNTVPYGLGEGHAAAPNVMDVSQSFGMIAGEGFPGGRPYFRDVNEMLGRYLGDGTGVVDTYPDIPKIPETSNAICSVWIAKSTAVTTTTSSMCGMFTGSSLGVVTAYSLGWGSGGTGHSNGDVTARWILSPGVPIIALKVDDNYSPKRKLNGRVWAVALNALGEVYYLTEAPTSLPVRASTDDATKNAWYAGRTAYWHLLEETRRVFKGDDLDKNADRGLISPRSPSNSMKLSKDQLAAEAREIEKFLHYRPSHIRKVCDGWDMRRRLEVDFAHDDSNGAGEGIFVLDCGLAENSPARIHRYLRSVESTIKEDVVTATVTTVPSLFGATGGLMEPDAQTPDVLLPRSPPPTPQTPLVPLVNMHNWRRQTLALKGHSCSVLSASALDSSTTSLLTLAEDPLHSMNETPVGSSSQVDIVSREIPGRRARLLVVGTKDGAVLVWNARDEGQSLELQPVRIIQTESPEISCVAATALYLVHGGSDGLVQAWDPLASTMEPIRTINARSNGRAPRFMTTINPMLRERHYSSVGAIYLDPDPVILRGVVSFGASMRYWSYGSTTHLTGRKRRLRHSSTAHGGTGSRRNGDAVVDYIAAEEAELRRENEQRKREKTILHNRFGVGALGDLTEEEALCYVQMLSEESFSVEEQRRASDSAAEASLDTASSFSENTADTSTPEPSITGPVVLETDGVLDNEGEYEQQIQQALRLSLLEAASDLGQSPQENNSGEFDFPVRIQSKNDKKAKRPELSSPSNSHTPVGGPSRVETTEDEDLALALSLSLLDIEGHTSPAQTMAGSGIQEEEFPLLDSEGVGKGKGVQRI